MTNGFRPHRSDTLPMGYWNTTWVAARVENAMEKANAVSCRRTLNCGSRVTSMANALAMRKTANARPPIPADIKPRPRRPGRVLFPPSKAAFSSWCMGPAGTSGSSRGSSGSSTSFTKACTRTMARMMKPVPT